MIQIFKNFINVAGVFNSNTDLFSGQNILGFMLDSIRFLTGLTSGLFLFDFDSLNNDIIVSYSNK